jgi:hypothetical protein
MAFQKLVVGFALLAAGWLLGWLTTSQTTAPPPRVERVAPHQDAQSSTCETRDEVLALNARLEIQAQEIVRLKAGLAAKSPNQKPAATCSPQERPEVAAKAVAALSTLPKGDSTQDQTRFLRYMPPRAYREYRDYRDFKRPTREEPRAGSQRDCELFPLDRACRGTQINCERESSVDECLGTRAHCESKPHARECRGTEAYCMVTPKDPACSGTAAACLINAGARSRECSGMKQYCEIHTDDALCIGTMAYCASHSGYEICQPDDV